MERTIFVQFRMQKCKFDADRDIRRHEHENHKNLFIRQWLTFIITRNFIVQVTNKSYFTLSVPIACFASALRFVSCLLTS
jgi:hypothetical protein